VLLPWSLAITLPGELAIATAQLEKLKELNEAQELGVFLLTL